MQINTEKTVEMLFEAKFYINVNNEIVELESTLPSVTFSIGPSENDTVFVRKGGRIIVFRNTEHKINSTQMVAIDFFINKYQGKKGASAQQTSVYMGNNKSQGEDWFRHSKIFRKESEISFIFQVKDRNKVVLMYNLKYID